MSEFCTVATVDDIPEGEGRAYPVDGRMVAVFRLNGEYSAINDTCPHMGASLASGYVEENVVTCPWHAWRFCVSDGTWMDNPNAKVKTEVYEVRVQDGVVQVKVPSPPVPPGDACETETA